MNILLADNRSRVRYALRVLFNQQPGWQVVGEATDTADLMRKVQQLHPDLTVIALDLPGLDLAIWFKELRQINPDMRIVVLSEQPLMQIQEPEFFDAYASKYNPPERLLAAIRALNGSPPEEEPV